MIDMQASCEVYQAFLCIHVISCARKAGGGPFWQRRDVGILFAIDSSYEQNDHSPNKRNSFPWIRRTPRRRPVCGTRTTGGPASPAGARARHSDTLDPEGQPIRDAETLARIKSLAIPPAWTDVWISPSPAGHIQATGRDAKGRKQYRYHPRWRDRARREQIRPDDGLRRGAARDPRAGRARPRRCPACRARRCWPPSSGCWRSTLIRVGNDEYARSNHSFGLTTMRDRHAEVDGSIGPVRVPRQERRQRMPIDLEDRRLARVVARCQDLPGQELFQYLDEDGTVQDVDSADVNEYLREIAGEDFTAKDFRTWAGTVLAALALQEFEAFDSQTPGQEEHRPRHRARGRAAGQYADASAASATSIPRSLTPTSTAR